MMKHNPDAITPLVSWLRVFQSALQQRQPEQFTHRHSPNHVSGHVLLACMVVVENTFVCPLPDGPQNPYNGQPCEAGYDSHYSPTKKELVAWAGHSDPEAPIKFQDWIQEQQT